MWFHFNSHFISPRVKYPFPFWVTFISHFMLEDSRLHNLNLFLHIFTLLLLLPLGNVYVGCAPIGSDWLSRESIKISFFFSSSKWTFFPPRNTANVSVKTFNIQLSALWYPIIWNQKKMSMNSLFLWLLSLEFNSLPSDWMNEIRDQNDILLNSLGSRERVRGKEIEI